MCLFRVIPFFIGRALFGRQKFPLGRFYQRTFEILGGAYIKAGQALAIRPDYLSPEQCEALSQLLDRVQPFSTQKARRVIQRELGEPIEKIFPEFADAPLASASLSQVYKAKTVDGRQVAVKVKRPGIDYSVNADIFFMNLMKKVISRFPSYRRLGVPGLIQEVVSVLANELNYRNEADNLELAAVNGKDVPWLKVPDILRKFSGDKVLTMEFLEGYSLRELVTAQRKGISVFPELTPIPVNVVARQIYSITLQTIFEKGIFHGDPHPGNIIVMTDGRIGMVDFGILGYMDKEMRALQMEYLGCLVRKDYDRASLLFTRILIPKQNSNYEGIRRAIRLKLELYIHSLGSSQATAADKSSANLFVESVRLASRYNFRLRPEIYLYYKNIFTIDQVLLDLDPEYNSQEETAAFLKEHSWKAIAGAFSEFDLNYALLRGLEMYNPSLQLVESGFNWMNNVVQGQNRKQSDLQIFFREGRRLLANILGLACVVSIAGILYYGNELPIAVSQTVAWASAAGMGVASLALSGNNGEAEG